MSSRTSPSTASIASPSRTRCGSPLAPPNTGTYRIDTGCSRTVDTLLDVSRGGPGHSGLVPVNGADVGCGSGSGDAMLALDLDAGTPYKIRVGARGNRGSVAGAFALRITAVSRPANDDLSDAQVVPEAAPTFTYDTTYATTEPGEPGADRLYGVSHSVWFAWTPTRSRVVLLRCAQDNFYDDADVYTGAGIADLSLYDYGKLRDPAASRGRHDLLHPGPQLRLRAGVVHDLRRRGWTRRTVDFGAVAVGKHSQPRTITLTNTSPFEVHLARGFLTTDGIPSPVIAYGCSTRRTSSPMTRAHACPMGTPELRVPSGGNCTVRMRFRPGATGARKASVAVYLGVRFGDDGEVIIPDFGVTGTGIAAAAGPTGDRGPQPQTAPAGPSGSPGPAGEGRRHRPCRRRRRPRSGGPHRTDRTSGPGRPTHQGDLHGSGPPGPLHGGHPCGPERPGAARPSR